LSAKAESVGLSPALERAVARGFGPEAAARPLEEDHCHTNENGGCNEIYPVYSVSTGIRTDSFWILVVCPYSRFRPDSGEERSVQFCNQQLKQAQDGISMGYHLRFEPF